jgi:hypothetical protein
VCHILNVINDLVETRIGTEKLSSSKLFSPILQIMQFIALIPSDSTDLNNIKEIQITCCRVLANVADYEPELFITSGMIPILILFFRNNDLGVANEAVGGLWNF